MTYFAVQSQKAVSAYITSKQIQPSGFAEQYCIMFIVSLLVVAANLLSLSNVIFVESTLCDMIPHNQVECGDYET